MLSQLFSYSMRVKLSAEIVLQIILIQQKKKIKGRKQLLANEEESGVHTKEQPTKVQLEQKG